VQLKIITEEEYKDYMEKLECMVVMSEVMGIWEIYKLIASVYFVSPTLYSKCGTDKGLIRGEAQ
jgi:hypothetical protein